MLVNPCSWQEFAGRRVLCRGPQDVCRSMRSTPRPPMSQSYAAPAVGRHHAGLSNAIERHAITSRPQAKPAMAGTNVRIDPSTGYRACLACRKFADANPPLIKPAVIDRIKRALQGGVSVNQNLLGHSR